MAASRSVRPGTGRCAAGGGVLGCRRHPAGHADLRHGGRREVVTARSSAPATTRDVFARTRGPKGWSPSGASSRGHPRRSDGGAGAARVVSSCEPPDAQPDDGHSKPDATPAHRGIITPRNGARTRAGSVRSVAPMGQPSRSSGHIKPRQAGRITLVEIGLHPIRAETSSWSREGPLLSRSARCALLQNGSAASSPGVWATTWERSAGGVDPSRLVAAVRPLQR